jgi:predicted PurR-regulated permease PerM
VQVRAPKNRKGGGEPLRVLSIVALAAFVLALLHIARDILIPIALATLLTFLLAPLVARLERMTGRVLAVLLVVAMIFTTAGAAGWVLTHQLLDLAERLPDYRENIVGRVRAVQVPVRLRAVASAFDEVRSELPAAAPPVAGDNGPPDAASRSGKSAVPASSPITRVEVVATRGAGSIELIRTIVAPVMGPLGTTGLVLLLVICMLLQREDLRRRVIRLVGQGHISATTRALDDAGRRVSRYLMMQAAINVVFGISIAAGLYFIGIPNAFLLGGLAAMLRFLPYVGAWIAGLLAMMLSLAVSSGWTTPLLTVGLFAMVELLTNNLFEPWLYGASTGVTPIALIIAAVLWTWLWGPVGLVLATPLTVCLVVLGRHVPELEFLGVLLSDEEALTPAEDFYQRMLTPGEHDEMDLVESFLESNAVAALYDDVLVPVVVAAERDARQGALDAEQLAAVHQCVRDVGKEVAGRPEPKSAGPSVRLSVLCLPVRAERDELAASMLGRLLRQHGLDVRVASAAGVAAYCEELGRIEPDVTVLSVVAPTSMLQARQLCERIRSQAVATRIVVGLWGAERASSQVRRLSDSGAAAVFYSIAEAAGEIAKSPGRDLPAASEPAAISA